jgi:hypothetical protein
MCSYTLYFIPIWLKYIYKILGIIQFSDNPSNKKCVLIPHLWPLPCYLFYTYTTISVVIFYETLDYKGLTNVMKYCDYFSFLISSSNMLINFFVFYRRTPRLKLFLYKIRQCDGTEKRGNKWSKIYFIILVSIILSFTHVDLYGIPTSVQLLYSIPIIINIFELLFVSDLLSSLREKFQQVNEQLKKEANLVDNFPLTVAKSARQIQDLIRLHYKLVSLAKEANVLFSTTHLASMVTFFCTVIDSIYFQLYLYAHYDERFIYAFMFCNFFWLGAQTSWFFMLLKSWSNTQDEVSAKSQSFLFTCVVLCRQIVP